MYDMPEAKAFRGLTSPNSSSAIVSQPSPPLQRYSAGFRTGANLGLLPTSSLVFVDPSTLDLANSFDGIALASRVKNDQTTIELMRKLGFVTTRKIRSQNRGGMSSIKQSCHVSVSVLFPTPSPRSLRKQRM